jgi:hypothetical protein
VRHTRLKDQPPLADLAHQTPRLAGHVGETCTEATAALLFDRSFDP